MAWTHEIRPLFRERQEGFGPQVMFAGALLVAAVASTLTNHYDDDLAEPLAVTLLFSLAALATLVAWCGGRAAQDRVSYWDVAGALTLIGIGTATLMIDPDQMVRVVESGSMSPHGARKIDP